MPLYVFRCAKCDKPVEMLRRMSDPLPTCAEHDEPMEKLPTAPGSFDLRGGGYYATDFKT